LECISRWSQRIASLGQPFPPLVERLAGLLEDGVPALKTTRLCPGHGSYNCNQIILAGRRTVVFDWDTCGLADPCRDITRFLVALQRLGFKYLGSIRALDGAAEVFKRTYSALNPFLATANLPWYTAFTCLTLAKYEVCRVSTFRHGIEALIREGLRALEE
jgi:aminoglycoside phosphotransferase (APT) family kinase protein